MREFRVEAGRLSSRKRTRRVRFVLWSAVAGLSAITLFGVYGAYSASPILNTVLLVLAVLIVAAIIVSAYLLAFQNAREVISQRSISALTDAHLVRRRSNYPDIQIGLGEISSVSDQRGWFVVESAAPRRVIAIPEEISGFQSLRAELTRHAPVVQLRRRRPVPIATIMYILCWAMVFWSKNEVAWIIAAMVVTTLLIWQTFSMLRPSSNRKRFVILGWVGLGWVAAALAVCFRVLRR